MDSAPITPLPPEPSPPGSAVKSEPEQPRLGIIHLMVWTACTGVYFSLRSPIVWGFDQTDDVATIVFQVGQGVGTSAALAGLLLAATRRWRGLPYPGQPGETLLLLLGAGAVMSMIQEVLLYAQGGPYMSVQGVLYSGSMCFHLLFLAVIHVIAAVRTKVPRWRWFFVATVVTLVLSFFWAVILFLVSISGSAILSFGPHILLAFSTIAGSEILYYGPRFLLAAFLIGIAARDFREHVFRRASYRWTHWLGIAVQLWSVAMLTAQMIWWTLSLEFP